MLVALNCVREETAGKKWKEIFDKTWPFYKNWFLIEGHLARKGYLECIEKLNQHMPELVPVFERLTALAGGGDLAARYLSMYCPPPYLTGCTQLAWTKDSISLIRNYDYSPKMFEGVMLYTNWLQPVIGISDCNWGLLDGMNGSGLTASLTFGGRKVIGEGFGIPLVMRYILETCTDVAAAVAKLKTIPIHMSYNITLVDKSGDFATVYLSPDNDIVVTAEHVGTNHQQQIEWHNYAALTATKERMDYLNDCLANPLHTETTILQAFFQPPVYCVNVEKNFATLYTAMYRPVEMTATILWPEKSIVQSFSHFTEQKFIVHIATPSFIN